MTHRKRKKMHIAQCQTCRKYHWYKNETLFPKKVNIANTHKLASIKRRRHRRDMRQNKLYRYVWDSLEAGLEKAMNKAFLGVEDPKEVRLRDFDGDLFGWLGLEEGVDYEITYPVNVEETPE